jgi:exodeoxyribonuclease VII large subunit
LVRSLDPKALLQRGYALVTGSDGTLVIDVQTARSQGALVLSFADGDVPVTVPDPDRPATSRRTPRNPPMSLPGLFD